MTLTPDVTAKLDSLSSDDYKMVVMLIERLADKPSSILKAAREKYLQKNPMTMEEIDEELQKARKHATEGKVQDAKSVSLELRTKYDL